MKSDSLQLNLEENQLPKEWEWERFKIIDAGNDEIALYNVNLKRFILMNQNNEMKASESTDENKELTDYEKFKIINQGNREIGLYSKINNRYLKLNISWGTVTTSSSVGPGEKFILVKA